MYHTSRKKEAYKSPYRKAQREPNYYFLSLVCIVISAAGAFGFALWWKSAILLFMGVLIVGLIALTILTSISGDTKKGGPPNNY